MSERNLEERLERIVRDLLAGRRLKIGPRDAGEREAIAAAARMAGLREPYPRMAPAFRRSLQRRLSGRREERGIVSRREALLAGLAAAAGVAGTGAVARVTGLFAPVDEAGEQAPQLAPAGPRVSAATEIVPDTGTWFDAGPLTALPEGQAVHFRAGSVATVLLRKGDSVRGLSAICTHLPCELVWNSGAKTLDCPCHPRSFDMEGQSNVTGTEYPLPPLPRVAVKVVDGRVQVLGA